MKYRAHVLAIAALLGLAGPGTAGESTRTDATVCSLHSGRVAASAPRTRLHPAAPAAACVVSKESLSRAQNYSPLPACTAQVSFNTTVAALEQ
jgi:hypothetical protein